MEGSLGRNTACREGKPISRWEWSDVTTLPPESWLITWRRGTISVWASVAARLGIQRCHSRSALENGSPGCWAHAKLPSLPPWHFVHEFIEWWQGWIGKEADWSSHPLYYNCPLEITLWWTLTWDTIMSNFLLIHRGLLTFLFPKFPSQQFCNHDPSKSLTIQPNH